MSTQFQDITDILMENGCSVTKSGIEALDKYITSKTNANRNYYADIYNHLKLDVEAALGKYYMKEAEDV